MQNLQVVEKGLPAEKLQRRTGSFPVRLIALWVAGILAAFALGTWLVWWAAHVQRSLVLEEIRGACQRVMPDTLERCVNTVIIQRGGVRR